MSADCNLFLERRQGIQEVSVKSDVVAVIVHSSKKNTIGAVFISLRVVVEFEM